MAKTDSSSGSDESDSEQDFSGSDQEVTWKEARRYKLALGKYKGKRLESMIKNKERRHYLKYLLGWDKLKEHTRANIEAAMEHYKAEKEHYEAKKTKA
jgi:hypothetical protein